VSTEPWSLSLCRPWVAPRDRITLIKTTSSTYVNQFNKYNLSLQVHVQADSHFRLRPEDLLSLYVRSQDGDMVPIGAVAHLGQAVAPPLLTLYNSIPPRP
jgi:HAE1 family hydrophobic/amphiphilic exporter-1